VRHAQGETKADRSAVRAGDDGPRVHREDDVRAGRPIRQAYDTWDTNAQWNYERGRVWGTLAPRDMPVRIGSRVNPAAIRFFNQCGEAIL
jgi:hypothetical protein